MSGRLFRKYAIIMVALVGGAVVATGLVQLYFSYQANRQALLLVQAETAGPIAQNIRLKLSGITGTVTDALVKAQPQPYSSGQWQSFYVNLLKQLPDATDIWMLDGSRVQQVHVSRQVPGFLVDPRLDLVNGQPRNWSNEFPQTAQPGPYHVTFASPGSPGQMRISIPNPSAVGASSGTGASLPKGATVLNLDLAFISSAMDLVAPPSGGDALLVDSKGRLLASTDPRFATGDSGALVMAGLTQAETSGSPSPPTSGTISGVNREGVRVLATFQLVDPSGWWVFVEQPEAQFLAPLWGLLGRTAILLVIALALAVGASFMLAQRLVQPIDALRRAAVRVAAGDLTERIQVETGDELQALGNEFNRMTSRLRESYALLEQKVQERTRDLARAVREIKAQSEQLEAANRHKSEFLASMSHELRTPLNAIIGFSEVLSTRMYGELNEKQAEYLEDVHSSGLHLLSLINDILDLAKVEAGRMEPQPSLFSLKEAMTNSLSMVKERASQHGISLKTAIDPAIDMIEADERKVKQVLFNLLSNAVKFTPTAGSICLRGRELDGAVEVSVTDTGIGIALEDQPKIFDEFQQVPNQNNQEGTGLGLTLAKKFIELQGGRLWVESTPGAGSTFAFVLPTRQVAERREYRASAPPSVKG